MRSIYLNIGSNKGDRRSNIERAVTLISEHDAFKNARIRTSPPFFSAPVGYASDAEFINIGVAIDFFTDKQPFTPFELLDITQHIEQCIGPDSPHRNADGTYCDRIVDIDIINIDGVTLETERLVLPHPRASARNFVMTPMAFLAPGWEPKAVTESASGHTKKSIKELQRDTVETFRNKQKLPIAVILDNIRSLNNVGSIFRTSDAFCVDFMALCGITATPPAPEIHKTALGAEESVKWQYFDTTAHAVEFLKSHGYTLLCLEQVHDSVSLECFTPKPDRKYAVVVGNEVSGVDQHIVNMCDVCIEIPQAGTKHSLNVAVSAAVALWHLFSHLPRQ